MNFYCYTDSESADLEVPISRLVAAAGAGVVVVVVRNVETVLPPIAPPVE